MYCENFHTSACRLPRTFRFREHSSENIANFNTTRTDWSQEAPGKVWEKTSKNMFFTPFVCVCVKKNEERSVSRVSNESFGSVTLTDYLNIEKSQESISYEPESV